ncbi:MAG: hypothetical protein KF789_12030 [Bdellovibrionaceae bacterium]|nr:hypothetical protein [Pseudobdellovibrionaceae bacterium]
MKALVPVLFLLALSSCASRPTEPQPRPHRATVVNDLFQVEQGMPVREVRKDQDFFFKKCEVDRSRPYFSKTEYECNDL